MKVQFFEGCRGHSTWEYIRANVTLLAVRELAIGMDLKTYFSVTDRTLRSWKADISPSYERQSPQ
jgi:hypothetical protein